MSSLPTLSNPITTVGRVAYNAKRSTHEMRKRRRGHESYVKVYDVGPASKAVNPAEAFSIQPHDLLLMTKSSKRRRSGRSNDTDIHVMSSANCAVLEKTDVKANASTEEKIEAYRNTLTFAGIATNAARYDEHNNNNEENFASQIGGLASIVNTGAESIVAGDLIYWDLPEPNAKNTYKHAPKSKALFVTKPLRMSSFKKKGETLTSLKNTMSVSELFVEFAKAHEQLKERVFARALSNAKQNESFDVILGNYCA